MEEVGADGDVGIRQVVSGEEEADWQWYDRGDLITVEDKLAPYLEKESCNCEECLEGRRAEAALDEARTAVKEAEEFLVTMIAGDGELV